MRSNSRSNGHLSPRSICNEYLEDVGAAYDAPSLFSSRLIERAHQRIVIDRFSSKLMPKFYSFLVRQVGSKSATSTTALPIYYLTVLAQ